MGESPAGAGVRLRYDLLAEASAVDDADVFDKLHRLLLAELHAAGELDWSKVF